MAACSSCGTVGEGNFCSRCGAAFDQGAVADPILFDSYTPPATETIQQVGVGSQRRNVALGVALVALFAAGTFTVLRAGEGEPEPEVALPPIAEDVVGDESVEAPEKPNFNAERAVVEGGEDTWLGAPADWYVLLPSFNGLVRLDPATGDVEDLGLPGRVVGRAWGAVILLGDDDQLSAVSQEALAGEAPLVDVAVPFATGQFNFADAVLAQQSSKPGAVWISDFEAQNATEYDLATGDELRTAQLWQDWFFSRSLSPGFRTPPAGGVYELQADGEFRLVHEGRATGLAGDRLLVQTCDIALKCKNEWLDPLTFEVVGELEAVASDLWYTTLLGNGRFVQVGDQTLVNIETGEEIQLRPDELEALWNNSIDVSPDGEMIATTTSAGLYVRSSGSATRRRADVPPGLEYGQLVIIPKPAPGN